MAEPFYSRTLGDRAIHYAPPLKLVYVNNPKAACTSIKKSLWLACERRRWRKTFEGNAHYKRRSPFLTDMKALAANGAQAVVEKTMFSAVRNPYVRILSAYLDKIGPQRDKNTWHPFCRRFGIGRDQEVPFDAFIELIAEEPDCTLNDHFAPQHLNLGVLLFELDFVARLENEEELPEYFRAHRLKLSSYTAHKTNAAARVRDYYTSDDLIARVYEYFKPDFEIFGYGKSIETLDPVAEMKLPKVGRAFLQEFTQSFTGPLAERLKSVDTMRAMLEPYYWLDFHEFEIRRELQLEDDEAIRTVYRRLAEKPNRNWQFFNEVCRYLLQQGLHADFEVFVQHAFNAHELTPGQSATVEKLKGTGPRGAF